MTNFRNITNCILPILAVFTIVLSVASCSSSRKAVEQSQGSTPTVDLPQSTIAQLISKYGDWTDLYVPVSVDLKQPVNFGFSGRATMVRNESIHFSMRILGMEVAVAHINNDSVWVADKFHRYLCAVPTAKLTGNNKFTISDLQDMLLGRAFYPGEGTIESEKQVEKFFTTDSRNDSIILSPRKTPKSANWHHIIAPAPNLSNVNLLLINGYWLSTSYKDFAETIVGSIASLINLTGAANSLKIDASLQWNLDKAKWNTSADNSWTPPTNYKRINATDLIKALKQNK